MTTSLGNEQRLSAYAATSKVAMAGTLAMAPFATADVVNHQLDTTFSLSQGEEGSLTLQGGGLVNGSSVYDAFSVVLYFDWRGTAIRLDDVNNEFEEPFFRFSLRGSRGTGSEIYTYGSGQVLGGSTIDSGARVDDGIITPGSETGVFFVGIHITNKAKGDWFGFIAMDLVSATELRVDHWAIQTENLGTITTTLPSNGDPVPGVGAITALALGAGGVRRSRRRLI